MSNKPKPTALRILQGNPGKRPLPKGEPKPKVLLPPCPKHLDAEARREWRRMGHKLLSLGLMTEIDRSSLAAYCIAWSRWVTAEEMIAKSGLIIKAPTGFLLQNPMLAIANRAMEQLMKLAVEFGMTPSARSRVKAAEPEAADEFSEFLKGRRA